MSMSPQTSASRSSGLGGPTRALLLAGSLRTARAAPLASALGIPTAALPIDGKACVLSWWLCELLQRGLADHVSVAIADEADRIFYERIAAEWGCEQRFSVWVDRAPHRGAGGTVRDYCDDQSQGELERGILVVECSTFGAFELGHFLGAIEPASEATVLATAAGQPCGVMHLTAKAVSRIPTIGYFDLKEQLLPALAAQGGIVPAIQTPIVPHRISDLRSYLALVAGQAQGVASPASSTESSTESSTASSLVSESAEIQGGANVAPDVLVGRGVQVHAGAVVVGSVLMPGAIVGRDAIVARSVIPPGSRVPAGARVIDEVFASLGESERGRS